MDALNILFGLITIASLIYAVWQNKRTTSLKNLTLEITKNIRAISQTIYEMNRNTPTEGYAKSIAYMCDSLILATAEPLKIGSVEVQYYAVNMPPLKSHCGELVDDTETLYRKAIKGRILESGHEKGLVYGPYEKLPVTGTYSVTFRLKGVVDESIEDESQVVRLDVYNDQECGVIEEIFLLANQISRTYVDYELQFRYTNLSLPLEYRVAILLPSAEIWFEKVRVKRVHR